MEVNAWEIVRILASEEQTIVVLVSDLYPMIVTSGGDIRIL